MPDKPTISATDAALRRRAEAALLQQQHAKATPPKEAAGDTQRLLHELQVHQIELEMQNAELMESRDQMESQMEKFSDLYDFAPFGYFTLDEQGVILEVNLTGAALLGIERSRLIKRRLQSFVAQASRADFITFLTDVFARPSKHIYEASILMEDGVVFWADLQALAATTPQDQPRCCRVTITDISALKRAEEALRRNEALFTTLIEQAPMGMVVVNEHFCLIQINAIARPTFKGIEPLVGRDYSEIIEIVWPAPIAKEVLQRFHHTLKTGQPYQSPEFSERRHDTGVMESYEWQLQRITLPNGQQGVVCFFNDITERKEQEAVQRRIELLAATNEKLELEIVQRQAGEVALKKSEQHLRELSHQLLTAQEEERRKISRELHDVITQTLVGINVHLGTLTKDSTVSMNEALLRKIAITQNLVEHSVNTVQSFARELRPTMLDDLGLIPALQTHLKAFMAQTGIRVALTVFAGVEKLDGTVRTVLYRVAQEALTNVARYAKASKVSLLICEQKGKVCMELHDNGQGFEVTGAALSKDRKCLGLLGMRERVEMIGGTFAVTSTLGKETTVSVELPMVSAPEKRAAKKTRKPSGNLPK